MNAIFLADLDDSLFQTLRKIPADVPHDQLTPLGYAVDGSALSYATPRQMNLLQLIDSSSIFIPVTARSLDALHRVKLPFSRAICAHGGIILGEDGRVDQAWHEAMLAASHSTRSQLAHWLDALKALENPRLSIRIVAEGALDLYVLIKHRGHDVAELGAAADRAIGPLPAGWTDHRNDNNIALMPPWLGKEKAVAHLLPALRAAHPDLPIIGLGDSLTDAPFMALCDFAMTPTGSQLAKPRLLP